MDELHSDDAQEQAPEPIMAELTEKEAFQAASEADTRAAMQAGAPVEGQALAHFSTGADFWEASTHGLAGRVLWAIANLGRAPHIDRIHDKAHPSEWIAGKHEINSVAEVREVVRALIKAGIVEECVPGRFAFVVNSSLATFAVRCSFCATKARPGRGKDEAKANAEAEGFAIQGRLALCPVHAEGARQGVYGPDGPRLNDAYTQTGGGGSIVGILEDERPGARVSKGARARVEKAQKRLNDRRGRMVREPFQTARQAEPRSAELEEACEHARAVQAELLEEEAANEPTEAEGD